MEQLGGTLESSDFISNSKISSLLQTLTAMAKKPTIESDISQALDEFLKHLNEYDKYLEHGIFNMNFAEAALLLQSSADIYSKKVDLLWDIIFDYQKRMLLTDKQNADKIQEIQKLEERKRKYKRKRKTKETERQTTQLVNNFSFGATEYVDYLNETSEPHSLMSEWEKLTVPTPSNVDINNITLSKGKDSLFLPTTKVHTEDGEYIGRYDQFHSASVIEEMFQMDKEQEPTCVVRTAITQSYITNNLLEKSKSTVPVLSHNFDQSRDDSLMSLTPDTHTVEQVSCRESYVCLERLPVNLVQEKLRRLSVADSLLDDDNFSSISENHLRGDCDDDNDEFDTVSGAIEKRNKSCSQDSAFYELEDDELMSIDGINTPLPESSKSSVINSKLCCGGSIIIPKSNLVKRKSIIAGLKAEDLEEKVKRRRTKKPRRISEKQWKKLTTGITVGLKEFEKFCRLQYKPAENEGEIPPEPESSDEDHDDSSDEEPTEPVLPETFLESDHEHEEPTTSFEPESTPSVLPPPSPPSETSKTPFTFTQSEESRKNVREWRDFIVPKLKNLENRSDFDIHEYGSRIMEGSEVGAERDFGSIVQGKGSAEVARYFLATLQLATTSNIAIVGAVPGKVANDSFKVKTLDKERYHERLDEYQAPSEETFRDRLEKAQAKNPKVPLHSTPSSPVKKIKLGRFAKKLF